jgi:TolB-like protein/class 3 adenylate cyclase/Tfp pilus assembly protein PilF
VSTEDFKRRLTAILSADVEGYSLLMREDEEATIRTLKTYRTAIRDLIRQYRGRLVDSPGDNLLAEFASVLDAVNCAVEIQRELAERNTELPENRRMRFRIGVNLGDIVEDGERIYGDGVNIAARMESLAEGGGICLSGKVYEEVKHKLGLEYEYQGEQEVKNIPEPIRVYKVLSYPGAAAHRVAKAKKAVGKTWRNAIIVIVAILVVGAAVAIWHFYFRAPPIEPASIKKMAFPLPDKPSIAVLPFDNLSGDPKQEYFSDGITEQIITGLSKVPDLFVIARNSSFVYKGKPVKIQKVAEDLGVRYVLEGSVQRSESRIRITAQLIDALTGKHLWAERYDRDLKDIFALQDEITTRIMRAMRLKIFAAGERKIWGKTTDNIQAYEKFLLGSYHFRRLNKADNFIARQVLAKAVSLDPEFAGAYVLLGWTHWHDVFLGSSKNPKKSLGQAFQAARKTLALDDSLAAAHGLLAHIYLQKRDHGKAVEEAEKAVSIDPNSADALVWLGFCLRYSGRPEEAISLYEKALRLNPFSPSYYLHGSAVAYYLTRRYDDAIAACKRAIAVEPESIWSHFTLSVVYSASNRDKESHVEAEKVLRINPKFSLEYLEKTLPFKNKADLARLIGDARKAGLPDKPPLPLPSKPSIAVLPFVNMSGDPTQEYFSDGITEEIITALSKVPELFIIARNSSFTYKGKSVWIPTVGKELGVKYVLEGSVRRAGDKVRVTAQLIEAKTNHHLWAERYDRDLKDVFAVQDDITKKIITSLQVKLTEGEQARVWARGTNNLQAYLKVLKARDYLNHLSKERNALARNALEEAIALDPNYAVAYELFAGTYWNAVIYRWTSTPKKCFGKCIELAKKATALDESLAGGYMSLVYGKLGQHEKRVALAERDVALNPNSSVALFWLGTALNYSAGKHEEAIAAFNKAIRLDPVPRLFYLMWLAVACRDAGRYDEAIPICRKILQKEPDYLFAHTCLASCYALMGRDEEARAEAAEVLRIQPKFSVDYVVKQAPYKYDIDRKRLRDSLLKAGLPH